MEVTEKFLSTRECAAIIGVAPITRCKWQIGIGGMVGPTFCKIGSRVVYDPAVVRAWMAARTARHTAEARQMRQLAAV